MICWCNDGFMISFPTNQRSLVRLGSGLHMFFLRSWKSAANCAPMFCGTSPDVWLHGYMKSLNPVFPLNSFRVPISWCIMLGNFHQGFVQPTSHSTTVRHQQHIAINKKAGGKAKVCIPEKSHGIHKKLVVFAKFVGRLHSSFQSSYFRITSWLVNSSP